MAVCLSLSLALGPTGRLPPEEATWRPALALLFPFAYFSTQNFVGLPLLDHVLRRQAEYDSPRDAFPNHPNLFLSISLLYLLSRGWLLGRILLARAWVYGLWAPSHPHMPMRAFAHRHAQYLEYFVTRTAFGMR